MRLLLFILLSFGGWLTGLSQLPILPNPCKQLDQFIINGVEIGESPHVHTKRLNDKKIISYISYIPAATFTNNYSEYDQLTNGNYGKLSIKNEDLVDIHVWNTSEIFTSQDYRIFGVWSLDCSDNRISLLVSGENKNDLSIEGRMMGLLHFDTSLTLISSRWFPEPAKYDYWFDIWTFKAQNDNYIRYGIRDPYELAITEFDTLGEVIKVRPLANGIGTQNGGQIAYMPNGELVLNPRFIVDTNFQILAQYNPIHESSDYLSGSIVPLDTHTFIYGGTGKRILGGQKYAYQELNVSDLLGKEKTVFYQEQNITHEPSEFQVFPGARAIEASDTNNIFFAFYSEVSIFGEPSQVYVSNIQLNGTVNWSRTFGGDSHYVPLDFIKTSNNQYHLIVNKRYDIAWATPDSSIIFPKSDLMFVTFDVNGNVVSISDNLEPTTKNKLLLYPNPTNGLVKIEDFGQFNSLEIELYDLAGRLVFHEHTDSKRYDVSQLISGLYIYRVFDGAKNIIQTGKLVIGEKRR
jgi:Secretion system C-terminal sorting domain